MTTHPERRPFGEGPFGFDDEHPSPESREITVLHVDDERGFLDLTATFLERERDDIVVETESDPEEALDRIRAGGIDCVVADYEMPGIDGLELLETVREEAPSLPFIIFTGRGNEDIASEAISSGVTDYMEKEPGSDQYRVLANRIANAVERHRTETALLRAHRRFETLIERSMDAIAVLDADGTLRYASPSHERITGYAPADVLGEDPIEYVHPEDRQRVADWFAEAVEHPERTPTIEYRIRHSDGHWIVLESIANNCLDDHAVGGIVANSREITEQWEREHELSRQNEQLRTMVENVPIILFAFDEEGVFTLSEGKGLAAIDLDPGEVVGDSVFDVYAEHEDVRASCRAALDGETVHSILEADGRIFDTSYQPVLDDDGDVEQVIGVAFDITERRERQRELEQYETMVETAPVGVFVLDEDGTVVEANDRAGDMFGYDLDDLLGEPVYRLVDDGRLDERHADAYRGVIEEFVAAEGDGGTAVIEVEVNLPDGDARVYETHITPRPFGDQFRGVVGVLQDVTERKAREWELERYETMVNAAGDMVYILDTDGRFRFVNDTAVRLTGYDREELLGEHVDLVMAESDIELGRDLIRGLVEADDSGVSDAFEWTLHTADGDTVPCESHITLLTSEGELYGTVGVVRDVTERRERERELERQNERLQEFASVVSHDLRNPLNVAQGNLALYRETGEDEHIQRTESAHRRMERIIDDLLALARQGEAVQELAPVDLERVAEAGWMNVETDGASLDVESGGTVKADDGRLQELLENLFRNAVEHGGDEVAVRVGTLADGRGFYVEDDGEGIPPEDRERVFESGYSSADDGTGFGLAIVQSIAEAHGWDIEVAESADGGARFEITGVDVA